MSHWLLKSEPATFGIEHLAQLPDARDHWDGVRNYQARNMLRDEMKPGDLAFFYHSNCKEPGIVGIVEVVREGYPDYTAWDPNSPYFDPKSSQEAPRWFMVDVQLKRRLNRNITLNELKAMPELSDMALVRKGNRLSVMPVSAAEWKAILAAE